MGIFRKRQKNVKYPSEEVQIGAGLRLAGAGIEGQSTWREVSPEEYEKRLVSMRKAKEDIPNLPLNDSFLRDAGLVYDRLTPDGKRNLNYLLTGKDDIPTKKYPPNTDATWVLPYIEELVNEYQRVVTSMEVKKGRIPFFKFAPIGELIVLSQYKGLAILFRKKMPGVFFATCDRPIQENFKSVSGPVVTVPDGAIFRSRQDDAASETIWITIHGSEDRQYFTRERARSDARQFAEEDIAFYGVKGG